MSQVLPRPHLTQVFLAFSLVGSLFGQKTDTRIPIQAQLIRPVEAGRIKVGESILARVTFPWEGSECVLRAGAILKGRIVTVSARSQTSKTSELALLFESGECGGRDMKSLPLTLAALIAPELSMDSELEQQTLSEAVGLAVNGGLRSVADAAAITQFEPPRTKGPKAVLPGQVIGIADLKIAVGHGKEGSSILSSSRRNVRLESGSQFVLVPTLKTESATAEAATSKAGPPSPSIPTVGAIDTSDSLTSAEEVEVCAPSECSTTLTKMDSRTAPVGAPETVPTKDLGYRMKPLTQELNHFDYESAITYLGPKLFFAFNPHGLVPRTGLEAKSKELHKVRGLLFNLETLKVEQTLEWRVPEGGQYLWPVGAGKALIHAGRELRLYGPDLRLEQKVSLAGPLAFVTVSPAGSYFAVGVINERHSEATHRQLLEAEDREPEEDVEVRVLDRNFNTLATVFRSSREGRPLLSDSGEIRLAIINKTHWGITESSWDGQHRVIAHFRSACRPTVTTLPSNLLFVMGCEWQADDKWYRVLRGDGTTALRGSSSSDELEQTAIATLSSFAIRIPRATKPMAANATYKSSDLEAEHIAVYRSVNGQRMISVNLPAPVPHRQTFALSPNGSQLAVLSREEISFYSLPTDP